MMSLNPALLMRLPGRTFKTFRVGGAVGDTVGTVIEGAGVGGFHMTLSKDPMRSSRSNKYLYLS